MYVSCVGPKPQEVPMSVVILRWNPEISSYGMNRFKNAMEEARNVQKCKKMVS